jgi:hypothetical protein
VTGTGTSKEKEHGEARMLLLFSEKKTPLPLLVT